VEEHIPEPPTEAVTPPPKVDVADTGDLLVGKRMAIFSSQYFNTFNLDTYIEYLTHFMLSTW
jgi:hypothetical protein